MGVETQEAPPLPKNPDAERAILGAVLLDSAAFSVFDSLRPEDFFLPQHQKIARILLRMSQEGKAADLITLAEELERRGELDAAGGVAYIAQLVDGLPRVSNVEHYARIVREKAVLRRISYVAQRIQQLALAGKHRPDVLARYTRRELLRLSPECNPTGKAGIKGWEAIPRLCDIKDMLVVWLCDGLVPRGEITLLAGEPGAYKSWLALRFAKAVAEGGNFLGRKCERADVLYLDRENPRGVVCERRTILGADALENVRYWDRLAGEPPPGIGDGRLLEIALARRPLIVFDSLVRFHSADENSATEMAPIMGELRKLADAGATVLLLHHKSKAE